jgi:ribosomal protein S18 acetylase RimI-like enzyme
MATITYHRLDQTNAAFLQAADVFDNPVSPTQLARFLSDEGHELVYAVTEQKVIGFASGTILLHPDKPPAFFLNEVDVTPAHQRQGIGTEICNRLMVVAQDRGCRGVWLATEEDNVAARALYLGLQARETKAIVVYDWDGVMDT